MAGETGNALYRTGENALDEAIWPGEGPQPLAPASETAPPDAVDLARVMPAAQPAAAAYVPFGGLAHALAGAEAETAAASDGDVPTPGPALPLPALLPLPAFARRWYRPVAARLAQAHARFDYASDLAEDIGTPRWYRGLGIMVGLIFAALLFLPSLAPLQAAPAMRLDATASESLRETAIMPLALGADTGSRMSALANVVPIASAPERPRLDLVATLAAGDSFGRMLQRAGVGAGDAARASDLIAAAVPLGEIAPGTRVDVTLGRRGAANGPRPLQHLDLRARFDMALGLNRQGEGFALSRHDIPVDATPLRIRGVVGQSLYVSARAAGAPAHAIQQYLQTLDAHLSLDGVTAGDTYDMIVGYKRAAGGESEVGDLLYAGLEHAGHARAQLLRWGNGGQFLDGADLSGTRVSTGLMLPVANGRITSGYGMRFHPILGYTRMHAGIDFGAPYGAPIFAVADGTVSYAGPHGGHGNYVRLEHGGGLGTGYAHMSRFAVSVGERVRAGEVIGYVGATGLATGPHLHYEVYRDGMTVNPMSVSFIGHAGIDPGDLAAFKARLARLLLVRPGAALAPLRAGGGFRLPVAGAPALR